GAVAALTYTVRQLGFVTSGRDLLPHGQPFVQREQEYSDDFPRLDQLVVAVEADDVARSKAYARRLAQELRKERDTFAHVTYRIDPRRFRGRELLYLSRHDLADLADDVVEHRRFLTAFAARPTLGGSSSWSRRGGSRGASRPIATRSDRCGRRWHGCRPNSRACAPASRAPPCSRTTRWRPPSGTASARRCSPSC